MINKFSCKNFRNIDVTDLQLARINLLIGPNNSGKTNFIKALTFYSDILLNANDGSLKTAFLNAVARNNWDHARNKFVGENEAIQFSWDIILNGEPVRYNFSFNVGNNSKDCHIVLEQLNSTVSAGPGYPKKFNYFQCHDQQIGYGLFSTAIKRGQKNQRLKVELNSQEILPLQFKDILLNDKNLYEKTLIRENVRVLVDELEDFFKGIHVYTSAQFNIQKLREPADAKGMDSFLKPDATNFLNVFAKLDAEDWHFVDSFKAKMQELIPGLTKINYVNQQQKLLFRLVYDGQQYDLSDVSEGTLKGILLNLLINMPQSEEQTVIAIDEPETNLHPAWQKVVGKWLQTTSAFQQCFISTHSPDFLDVFTDMFKLGKVAVFVFDKGITTSIRKVTYEEIKDEMGDWELGDLYRTNDPALGGWPW